MNERRLGAAEVQRVFERAAATDAARTLPTLHDPTVADLMEMATEVGLDPQEVRRAASLTLAPSAGGAAALLGAPSRRVVRATTSSKLPAERSRLTAAAEQAVGRTGSVEESEPDRWTWQESHGIGRTTASVARSTAGGTHLVVTADRSGHYLGYWFAGLLGWAAASALLPITLPPVLAVAAFLVTPPILARPFWRAADRRARASMEAATMALLRALDAEEARAASDMLPPSHGDADGPA